jgi:hypothetical protein
MLNVSYIFFELMFFMIFYIIIFIIASISADQFIIFTSIILFLILLIPYLVLLNQFNILTIGNNNLYFKILSFISPVVNIFIGIFLFIDIIYVHFFG